MSKIAIIDDAIYEQYGLESRIVERYRLHEGTFQRALPMRPNGSTHGSWVAHVLEQYADDYEIVSIQLVDNWFLEPLGNMQNLVRAFEFCLSLDIDIISVSLGSEKLSEAKLLKDVLLQVEKQEIPVIAAYSNAGHKTIPAACKHVIGVVADRHHKIKQAGHYGVCQHAIFGTRFIAKYSLDVHAGEQLTSNSLAVPVMTARVNKIINQGKRSVADIIVALMQGAEFVEKNQTLFAPPHCCENSFDIPILLLADSCHHSQEQLQLIERFCAEGYEVLGVAERQKHNDPRVFEIRNLVNCNLKEIVQQIAQAVKCDMIIIFLTHQMSINQFMQMNLQHDWLIVCKQCNSIVQEIGTDRVITVPTNCSINELCKGVLRALST